MKTLKIFTLMGTLALAIIFAGCTKDDDDAVVPDKHHLSNTEKSGLVELIQIEKLHKEVYADMYTNNPCELYDELCSCDGKLMAKLEAIFDKYRIENPIADAQTGVYVDKLIQAKYNEYLQLANTKSFQILEFAKAMEKQSQKAIEKHMVFLEGNNDVLELYEMIRKESNCQVKSINDKLNHSNPEDHPPDPPAAT
jgi:hypothetical protein